MSNITSFKALRPNADDAGKVSCIPYDVAAEEEVREIIADNPKSFLRVTRPEAESDDGSMIAPLDAHKRAALNLNKFIEEKTLTVEQEESFYIYRLQTGGHSQTGIVACCSLEEYEKGNIKRHEQTRPDKVEDRMQHMMELRAQTGLIFLAFRGTASISALVKEITAREPLFDFVCQAGIRQTVWKVSDTTALSAAFSEVPSLYIADGHHRIESAYQTFREMAKINTEHTGKEPYNFVMAGIFPAEELQILPYNRIVKDLGGLSTEQLITEIEKKFTVERSNKKTPEAHGEMCMYLGGDWYDLKFRHLADFEHDPIKRLDVSILQDNILAPLLGIIDPTTDKRIGFVGGIRGTAELEKLVNKGKAQVAFSMFPTTIDDLFAVSDLGKTMPPKSTWFEPKLKDGLFVHTI